ncbi:MAG: DegT/DnrJ/EryC1/StrS family aminotransferase [Gemmatimonadetes bacterium]|nr:DegT/DnrJ/EryC1/StrS family aminotransferase [Gemmatimonadota bacterium]MYG16884.1 DegT/DnrJ/EryC1/StrS family aminotransferase [Gemmatimonadota bacterium]
MPRLAINGAAPVRTEPFPFWPMNLDASARAAGETVRSGLWGSIQGEKVRSLEHRFASFQHAAHGIAVSNGTTALCLALQAIGIEPGDEVILPAYTFIASASSVVMSNAVPVFVDIDPLTYNLDPDRVEEAVTPRTRAVVAVHFAGLPADMDRINEIAGRHGLAVIEDAAQAHGARWGGRGVGAIGSIGAFSFQSSKNLTAGEGGIMLTNDDGLAAAARSLADCGHAEQGPRYNHFRVAGNNRMTEVQGALLLVQMDHLEAQADQRHANGEYLTERLGAVPGIVPVARPAKADRHARHIYMFRYNEASFGGVPKTRFIEALRAEGIPASPGYSIPLYKQPVFTERNYGIYQSPALSAVDYGTKNLPVTEQACRSEAVWFTQNVLLGDRDDMDDIVRAVAKIGEHRDELGEA